LRPNDSQASVSPWNDQKASLMENEIWKPVPDWEGLYEVSNMGRVRSLDRQKTRPIGSVMAPINSVNEIQYRS